MIGPVLEKRWGLAARKAWEKEYYWLVEYYGVSKGRSVAEAHAMADMVNRYETVLRTDFYLLPDWLKKAIQGK